jgi:hypothetical protein
MPAQLPVPLDVISTTHAAIASDVRSIPIGNVDPRTRYRYEPPRRLIAWVARAIYNEPYVATTMEISFDEIGEEHVQTAHRFRFGGRWNTASVRGKRTAFRTFCRAARKTSSRSIRGATADRAVARCAGTKFVTPCGTFIPNRRQSWT